MTCALGLRAHVACACSVRTWLRGGYSPAQLSDKARLLPWAHAQNGFRRREWTRFDGNFVGTMRASDLSRLATALPLTRSTRSFPPLTSLHSPPLFPLASPSPHPPPLPSFAQRLLYRPTAAKELLFDWVPPNMFVGPYPQCDEDVQTMKVRCGCGTGAGAVVWCSAVC